MKLKKFLSLVLCVSMVLSTMSFNVFAEETVSNFDDLKQAIMNASAGDTIVLGADIEKTADKRDYDFEPNVAIVIDLNNNTLSLNGDNLFSSDITFKNGTIKVGPKTSTAFIWMWDDADLVLDNVKLISDAAIGYSIISGSKTGSVEMINSTITVTDSENNISDKSEATVVADCKNLLLTNTDIVATNVARGLVNVEINADNKSSIVMDNNSKTALRNVSGAIDCEVTITDCDYGVENESNRVLTFKDNAKVSISGSAEKDVFVKDNANVIVTPKAEIEIGDDSPISKYAAKIDGEYYLTFADAAKAAEPGDTIELEDGEYTMPSIGKDVTIKGSRNVIIGPIGAYGTYASLTFDGITLKFTNDNYKGFQHSDVMTYNNVKIVGQPFLYGNVETFNNCEFVQESANAYNVWTYSAKNVTFNGCTFKSAGKSVLIYNESSGDTTVDVVDCELTATASVEGKAAFEIHTKGGACYLTIDEETSATGFATGSVSGNSLWNDKSTEKTDALNDVIVKVDDEVVLARTEDATKDVAAIVDNELFDSLSNAVKALKNDSTMIILEGEHDTALEITESNVTVIASGEVTLTQTPKFKGSNYYVEGINFVYNDSYNNLGGTGKFVDCDFTANVSTFRYCYASTGTIEFNGCNLNAGAWAIHFDQTGGLDLVFTDCDITGRVALSSDLGSLTATGTSFNDSYVNIWGTVTGATFDDCEFSNVPYIFTGYDLDNAVEFIDCTTNNEDGIAGIIYGGIDNANAHIEIDGEILTRVAKIGDDYYKTLEAAVAAAQSGDVIDLMGNTAEFTQANVGKALKIANGTIKMNPAAVTFAATTPATYWFVSDDITFENITFTGENYDTAGWGVFYLTKTGASVNFVNSIVNLKNDISLGGGFIKGDVAGVTVSFDNTDVYLENTKRGFNNLNSLTLFNDSDFVLKGTTEKGMENAINKAGLVTINDTSSIEIDGCFEYGIKMDNSVYVNDEAKVVVRNSGIADIMERENAGNPGLRVNDDAIVIADIITPEVWVITQGNGEVIEKSENIYVQFKKVDIDADKKDTVEGSDKYEIILTGYKHNINRLTTADLTFKLDAAPYANANMAYTIEPRAGITLTPHDADGYMFNFNGVTAPDETGENIVIGYVTISGYGNYSFSVAADNIEKGIKNIVNATEVQDSIVDTFVIDGATDKGTLIINTKIDNDNNMVGIIDDVEIKVPVKTLKVNVTFPNAVVEQNKAYQDMKVEITGTFDGVKTTRTYNLGEGEIAMNSDGAYVFEEENLVINESYTVTVSGAGYRTARYTVRMTDNKELKFWNNVMDEAQVIEIGNDSVVTVKNFLAGDIVKDNQINIYDLSAVVSYFGTSNKTNAKSDYAKYDLNRDGVIDSKDVAYVLVSWGE